ncbi:MAG: sulfite exporter TauE/SafE family protein [Flavobacterium sp.]|nr:MAG: sulfite exporter TauE/SafE family protein [Flavobacterium sp.]
MLATALILGLISSLHCIAMCGPVAMMLPVARNNPEKKALQIMTYHLGRLTSYTSLGLLFGCFGRGLYLAGMQQWLSILAGCIMILIVVIPEKKFAKVNLSQSVYRLLAKGKSAMGARLRSQSFSSIYTIGLLNGLLPCAMVYAALFGALATQQVFLGAAYMALFGLGTVPLMSAVTYVYRLATDSFRIKIQKTIPYVMAAVGIVFIARGLSLGNSHFSPSNVSLSVMAAPHCK